MKKINCLASIGAVLLLNGCSATAENCDPSVDPGFFSKMGCIASGSYAQRVEQKKQQVADLRAELSSLSKETQELYASDTLVKEERAQAQSRLDRIDEDLSALKAKVSKQTGESSALSKQIAQAQAQSKTVRNLPESASVLEKKAEKQKLQKELDDLYEVLATAQNQFFCLSSGPLNFKRAYVFPN